MCGRFSQTKLNPVQVPHLFADVPEDAWNLPASYNLAPTQMATVYRQGEDGPVVKRLAWGLLPFWAKKKSFQGSTLNAKVETVATKPSFRSAFKAARRCIIPMAGYFEWVTNADDGKKDPWFIHGDGPLWASGLWEGPSPLLPEGNEGTFTVIVGESSGVSADIHDRMPVWVDPAHMKTWLTGSPDDAMAALLASPLPRMEAYRVSRRVNTPKNNDPSLLDPVAA